MIDLHCHLDLYPEPLKIIRQIAIKQSFVLAVTTTPMALKGTQSLTKSVPQIQVSVGLHPELVASRSGEISKTCDLIKSTAFVGEIGLDGSKKHRATLPIQRRAFEEILHACELHGGRIMTIHSRNATTLVLDHLDAHPGSGTPVLHWFSGSKAELTRAIKMGCWFSVGPAMLRGAKGRALTSLMPINRVLTETDGPLARSGGESLMPWDVRIAEEQLAGIWGVPFPKAREVLNRNLMTLVGHKAVAF